MDSAQSSEGQTTGIDASTTALPQTTATPDSSRPAGGLFSRARNMFGGGQPSAEPALVATSSLATPDATTPTPAIANWPASEGGVTPGIAPNYSTGSATGEASTSGTIAPTPAPELPANPWAKAADVTTASVEPTPTSAPEPAFQSIGVAPIPDASETPEPTVEPSVDATPAVAPVWTPEPEPETVVETTTPTEPKPALTLPENPTTRLSEADVAEFRRILTLMDPRVLGPDVAQSNTEVTNSSPDTNNVSTPIDQASNTMVPPVAPSTTPSSSLV